MRNLTLFLISCTLLHCAGDIRGAPGADAINNPLVRIARPSFRSISATKLQVHATPLSPALFKFGSDVMVAESNLELTLSPIANPSTVYYLYGIRNGNQPALLADTRSPEDGPSGILDWTYLGSFLTDATSKIVSIVSSDGEAYLDTPSSFDSMISETIPTNKLLKLPISAASVYGRVTWNIITQSGVTAYVGPSAANLLPRLKSSSAVLDENSPAYFWTPITDPQSLFFQVELVANPCSFFFRVLGWKENLLNYP